MALVSLPGPCPAGVALTRLTTSALDLAVPAGHPLADRTSVPLTDLADLDFVDSPVGHGNRAVTDRAFTVASLNRRIAVESTGIATGAEFVRHGLGVALLPRFALAGVPGVTAIPVPRGARGPSARCRRGGDDGAGPGVRVDPALSARQGSRSRAVSPRDRLRTRRPRQLTTFSFFSLLQPRSSSRLKRFLMWDGLSLMQPLE
ncbi:LysR substrate-binding domain-containing protein [Streptomyces sp. NPDC048290]|uniref:LysR substrate-binding domain-containing protein n=1 Tax=Streptomyces sp. NPDC048290 TaxID=3155811 RepID=UPI003436CCA5